MFPPPSHGAAGLRQSGRHDTTRISQFDETRVREESSSTNNFYDNGTALPPSGAVGVGHSSGASVHRATVLASVILVASTTRPQDTRT